MTLYTNEPSLLDKRHRKYFNFYKQYCCLYLREKLSWSLKTATLYSINIVINKKDNDIYLLC